MAQFKDLCMIDSCCRRETKIFSFDNFKLSLKARSMAKKLSGKPYRVFVSHGWTDKWVAEQIARRLKDDCSCEVFIDVFDIAKGDDIEDRIFKELPTCRELVALLTPWSADRNWVRIEIGAARAHGLRVVAVLYGITLADLDKDKGGKGFLGSKNIVEINNIDDYLREVAKRAMK